jgi:putative spermidine/putrescine transport system permease protein
MSASGGVNRLHHELPALTTPAPPAPARKRGWSLAKAWWWIVFILGFLYFFLPLIGTLAFSLRAQPFGSAYTNAIADPQFASTLGFSFVIGVITIIVSIAIIVPTAFWVRLKLPRWRPVVSFITLLPFVVPPIILVFGLIKTYGGPPLPLTYTSLGSNVLLIAAYVVLSFPYMYRAVDTGLGAIDVQVLTEASQSLGAGWVRLLWQVILPNLRVALLSGAFLTLAIVVGEFTIANYLARPAFGPYLSLLGGNKAYEPAAVSLISFGLTWLAMGMISLIGRSGPSRVSLAGTR